MNKNNKLASQLAVGLALAMLVGTSAFAETRHSDETRGRVHRGEGRSAVRSEGRSEASSGGQRWSRSDGDRSVTRREESSSGFRNRDAGESRNWDRNRNDNRSNDNNRSYDRNRNDNRSYDNRNYGNRNYDNRNYGNRNDRRYDNRNDNRYDNRRYDNRYDNRSYRNDYNRRPYYAYGRVSRLVPYHGGYRVWVGGIGFPFFIPEARFRLFPLRVGINIRIGGYYNPLGYYDYYDVGPYTSAPVYTSGELRGVVESVDYRRGTLVLRDDLSGSFVTVLLTRGDRLMDDLRPGDYVDLTGAWTRGGYFEAYRVASLDNDDGYRY